jgi:hypothetical protein
MITLNKHHIFFTFLVMNLELQVKEALAQIYSSSRDIQQKSAENLLMQFQSNYENWRISVNLLKSKVQESNNIE